MDIDIIIIIIVIIIIYYYYYYYYYLLKTYSAVNGTGLPLTSTLKLTQTKIDINVDTNIDTD